MGNTVINTPELLNLDSTTGATVLAKGTISERPATPTFSVDYLVVAGGGGGGGGVTSESPGAGGAGAVIYQAAGLNVIPLSEYTLYIADGGTGGGNNAQGTNGQDSYISFSGSNVVLAKGGGGGGSNAGPGKNGGSGGGGTRDGDANSSQAGGSAVTTNIAPTGASIYGNNGATGTGTTGGSGGGGGAGGAGAVSTGGDGIQINIDGNNYYWGGGGGAGGSAGTGGQGGGGGGPRGGQGGTGGINPGTSTGSSADGGGNGGANTGGGGGGATNPTGYPGGTGGSGIIILRYPNTQTITIGSGLTGTTATVGSEKVTTFTAGTGTISFSGTVVGGENDATDGALRFNTDTNKTEYFDGTGWYEIVDEYASGFIGPGTNYFNTKLYTGNGGTQALTGVGFAPDMTWIKARSAGYSHSLQDTLRGPGTSTSIYTDLNSAAGTYGAYGQISAFGTDGFTVASGGHGIYPTAQVNQNGVTYASWNWKAGGAAVSNTDGTITSQVSANKDSGFSIVKWTGTEANATIGHGIDTPELIIIKNASAVKNWTVYSSGVGATKYGKLNLTDDFQTASTAFNNTDPTSSVFSVGSASVANGNGNTMIAYCWHSVAGYSKIGSYTGNGVAGNTIATGFEPAFVMIKRTSAAGSWYLFDNKRTTGVYSDQLEANTSNAEYNGTYVDLDSNGFLLNTTASNLNENGSTFIFMAIA